MQIIQGPQYFRARQFTDLRDMLIQSVEKYSSKPAFRFREQPGSEPVSKTYQQFFTDWQALGTALVGIIPAGSRLAIVGENSYAWCLAHIAAVCGLGVAVPLDRMLPEEELFGLLERGEVDFLFYDGPFHSLAVRAAQNLPRLRNLVCLRPSRLKKPDEMVWQSPDQPAADGFASFYSLNEMLACGRKMLSDGDSRYTRRPIDPQAMASLLFTSGTTSASKAVMLSHHNICADIRGLAGVVRLPAGIRLLSVLPLHHTFENTCGLFMALYVGGTIHESDGLRYIQKNLQEYSIDMIIGVPLLFNNFYQKIQDSLKKTGKGKLVSRMIPLTQALRRIGIDLRPLVYRKILAAFGGHLRLGICGAAPIDPEIISFLDAIGLRVLQGYGLTETAPVVSGCNSRLFIPGTVGRPLSGMTIAIDAELPGEPGEILIRGENVMLGYFNDPEATREVIDDAGWFHSGDIGCLDPATNCLTVTSRVKSMIVLKTGKKIFPEEIEHLIGQTDFIKESLVWGSQDADGEVILSAKLVIDRETLARKQGGEVDDRSIQQQIDQLIKEINAALPSFKTIRQYVFSFQEMVKTTTMKIRRPVEIGIINSLIEHQQLKWRDLSGQNIDSFVSRTQGNPAVESGG